MERTRNDPFNPPKPSRAFSLEDTEKRHAVLDLFTKYECLPGTYLRHGAGVSPWTITKLNNAWYIHALPYSPKPSLLDARNREPVWIIGQRGKALLGKPTAHSGDHMRHKVGRTLCQYSFDVAPQSIPPEPAGPMYLEMERTFLPSRFLVS